MRPVTPWSQVGTLRESNPLFQASRLIRPSMARRGFRQGTVGSEASITSTFTSRRRPGWDRNHHFCARHLHATSQSAIEQGGPGEDRTPALLNAIQARSQLRYRPVVITEIWLGQAGVEPARRCCRVVQDSAAGPTEPTPSTGVQVRWRPRQLPHRVKEQWPRPRWTATPCTV